MRKRYILIVLLFISLIVIILSPVAGTRVIPMSSIFSSSKESADFQIFWEIRMPRILTAFLAGAALAVSGMALQALFRNPLATPFTLGISSGASLGAVMYILLARLAFIGTGFIALLGQSLSALIGASIAISLVYGLTRLKRGFSTATMLLAGVAVNFFFSSMILFIQYISDFAQSFRIIRWLMGNLSASGYDTVLGMLPFVFTGILIIALLSRELNLMSTGEEIAASRGVNVTAVKTTVFLSTSLMVGGIVAACGPIGFIGMMAPHICRLIIGPDHRYLMPASLLFGGMFLTLCDTIARTVIAPAEIPVGVITSLLGGPFFIWLLLHGSSERSLV